MNQFAVAETVVGIVIRGVRAYGTDQPAGRLVEPVVQRSGFGVEAV